MKIKKIDLDGNMIELKEKSYNSSSSCRGTYNQWQGVYKIVSSTEPVTKETVEQMLKNGEFGYGQSVNAIFIEPTQEIYFSGTCDSGD